MSFREEFAKIRAEISQSPHAQAFDKLKTKLGCRPLILYGAGAVAGMALRLCIENGIEVPSVCDSNAVGIHERSGLPIISPAQLVSENEDAFILITSWKYEKEIAEKLKSLGFPEDQIFPFRYPPRISINEFSEKYLEGYEWAYDFFQDEISQRLVINRARSYLLSEILIPSSQSELYYEDGIVSLGEKEVFVDGGAYNGDSAERFIQHVDGKYSHIYAFEPDLSAFGHAARNLSEYQNVDVISKGLWSFDGQLPLYCGGFTASTFVTVSPDYYIQISPVTSLDISFKEMSDNELPTFIKADVEGAEKEVLHGAENIIRRVKPRFAICAYHKPEDIYELPQTILGIRDDYRFTLRQYDYGYCETILYAV